MPRILRIVSQPQSRDLELQYAVGNAPIKTIYMNRSEALALAVSLDRALVKQSLPK